MLGILLAIVSASGLLCILMIFSGKKDKGTGGDGPSKKPKNKNAAVIIKECTKKLAHDAHNISALKQLGAVYYEQQNYEKAFPIYQTLFNLMNVHVEIDQMDASLKYGVSAFKTGKLDDAMTGLTKVLRLDPKNYDANFYVGRVLYDKKDFDKSILCLKRAAAVASEKTEVYEPLAFSLYNAKKYRESLPYLKKVLDEAPENKEALFYAASAMEESGAGDKALKIFMHLRPDPTFGPQSCVAAGSIHEKQGQFEKAIQDYEIALKLENIPQETKLTIYYKLAQVYLKQHAIGKALTYLKQIQSITPNYRDVASLVSRYQELNQNSNLQAYIMSGTSDFVALCRKFVEGYYPGAFVKIEDISVAADSIEVLCSVETSKWEDKELFRFFRSSGSVGELYVRDFHSKMRDIKCDRGFCVTAGSFSEDAAKYVEGRPIDLIEKNKLVQVLKKLDVSGKLNK